MSKDLTGVVIYYQTEGCLENGGVFFQTFPYDLYLELPSIHIDNEGKDKIPAYELFDLLEKFPDMLQVAFELGQQNPNAEISQYWK